MSDNDHKYDSQFITIFPLTPAQAGVGTYFAFKNLIRPYPCLRRDERDLVRT